MHEIVDQMAYSACGSVWVGVQVLTFRDPRHAFGGFERPEDARAFAQRLRHLPALWCCHADGGSIAYSLLHHDDSALQSPLL